MLSRQWPRPISRNAAPSAHHVSMTTAAMTTPNVCDQGHHDGDGVAHRGDAAQLVAQRPHRHRPGVEAVGREHVGQERRSAAPSSRPCRRSYTSMIATINSCNTATLPAVAAGDQGIRPFNARSLVLSVLLGLEPPVLPVRSLVAVGELFGIAPGTMRTALSRMVAAGELSIDDDGYRLVRAGCSSARRPRTSAGVRRRAAGTGRGGSPSSRAPRRSIAERRAFRTHMANAAHGRAAARHVDAPGQPRRSRRRRLAASSCAAR